MFVFNVFLAFTIKLFVFWNLSGFYLNSMLFLQMDVTPLLTNYWNTPHLHLNIWHMICICLIQLPHFNISITKHITMLLYRNFSFDVKVIYLTLSYMTKFLAYLRHLRGENFNQWYIAYIMEKQYIRFAFRVIHV